MRFLLDEGLNPRIAGGLRERGIDAVSVYDVDRAGRRLPDAEQLTYATRQGRVLVTYNRADYQLLDGRWRAEERRHAGIVWCSEQALPRRALGDLVRALAALAASKDHPTLTDLCLPLRRVE
jgi:predicted nuclease of predicted toxin-antitoxin system